MPKKEDQNHDILLDKIYKELVLTERPLLLIGHGVRLSNAQKKLRKFIEKSKIPSVFTWNACDILEFESRTRIFFSLSTASDFLKALAQSN